MTKTILVTQGCFSYCWSVLGQHPDFFCFSHLLTSKWPGGVHKSERGHSQDSWPQMTKGYPILYNIMVTNKTWVKEEERRNFPRKWCFPKSPSCVMQLCFPGDGLPRGSDESNLAFAVPIKLPLSQFKIFLPFTIPILFPIFDKNKWLSRAELLPGVIPQWPQKI